MSAAMAIVALNRSVQLHGRTLKCAWGKDRSHTMSKDTVISPTALSLAIPQMNVYSSPVVYGSFMHQPPVIAGGNALLSSPPPPLPQVYNPYLLSPHNSSFFTYLPHSLSPSDLNSPSYETMHHHNENALPDTKNSQIVEKDILYDNEHKIDANELIKSQQPLLNRRESPGGLTQPSPSGQRTPSVQRTLSLD